MWFLLILILIICIAVWMHSTQKNVREMRDLMERSAGMTPEQLRAVQEQRRQEIVEKNRAANKRFYATIIIIFVMIVIILITVMENAK